MSSSFVEPVTLAARGVAFLDAPCTGSKGGAERGALTFMVGGKREVFDQVTPYFKAMGTMLYYCGGPGMGLHAKLSQNMILGNLLQAFNESFVLAVKCTSLTGTFNFFARLNQSALVSKEALVLSTATGVPSSRN